MNKEQIIAMNQYNLQMFSSIFGGQIEITNIEPTDEELKQIEAQDD